MGFLSKLMGMGGSKSDAKKEEIRQIFNSKVQDGESYNVVAATHVKTEHTLLKETRTFYNYIVGYKDGEDPEIVIISTTYDLSDVDEPIHCKRSECTKAFYSDIFSISHPQLGSEPLLFTLIASSAWGGYIIPVSYIDEFFPFSEFFQHKFAK